jgi:hypothetical protein
MLVQRCELGHCAPPDRVSLPPQEAAARRVVGLTQNGRDRRLDGIRIPSIRPGSRLYFGTGCAAPRSRLAGLEGRRPGSRAARADVLVSITT